MNRFLIALSWVSAAVFCAGILVGAFLDVFPQTCLFRIVTGRPCVFCGMMHATAFAVRGDFGRAGLAHPAWFIVLPSFLFFVAAAATRRARLSWSLVVGLALGTVFTVILR